MTGGSKLVIETPEGISFSLPLAGPVLRSVALFVDYCAVNAAIALLQNGIDAVGILWEDLGGMLRILTSFTLSIGYGMACEAMFNGRTLGKRLMSLRVIDERGLRLRFSQVALRNLLRYADLFPAFYGLGGLVSLVSRRCQRLGDLAAGTIVVREEKREVPRLDALLKGRENSFKQCPLLEARLRQLVNGDEGRYALSAIQRRAQLEDAAAMKLFSEMAERFRELVLFPEEMTRGLSDEQYVRNVVDTLYRRQMVKAEEIGFTA